MINSRTKIFAVIGRPVRHSLSPILHDWFIKKFRLNAAYAAFEVDPGNLEQAVNGLRALSLGGFNVTIPHKESILQFVDETSDSVALLGAANTLKNKDGLVKAFGTDPFGFVESLGEDTGRFKGARVVVFGAGGSAKSIVYALGQLQVHYVCIVNRSRARAEALAGAALEKYGLQDVSVFDAEEDVLNDLISAADILINTTSVGMHPRINESILPDSSAISKKHFAYDLVYNPGMTKFLADARMRGAEVQSGLDMLIFQGLESVRIWHDEHFEIDKDELKEIRKILKTELGINE
ncbi:MAG: shikimate dehydrogenase [Calditrichaeota bacterium]|nr:shikimate dehydrogenase [Calditrichota bacterium]